MRDRIEKILKLACLALGALLAFQATRAVIRSNPLAKVNIPQVPSLPTETNAPGSAAETNHSNPQAGTNRHFLAQTNLNATNQFAKTSSTNKSNSGAAVTTNAVAVSTDAPATTNSSSRITMSETKTNAVAEMESKPASTDEITMISTVGKNTNSTAGQPQEKSETNSIHSAKSSAGKTNTVAPAVVKNSSGPRPNRQLSGRPGMHGGKPLPNLSPAIQARVDRIYESELFGDVMHPMPAALMGIAGDMAFLRSSSGQTGLVKEGDSLGEMKLLRIGINRVLVEEKGEQKELMIFNGYGGESLLSKKETPDETIHK